MATPDPMMDLIVVLCYPQGLTADHTSSLLSLPEIFHPTATCPRLGQLPTQPCLQVQFPPRIVGIDGAADLHIANDLHLGCCHQLDRPALAFLVPQRTGEDPVALSVVREIVLLEPFPALLRVPSPTPAPHHLEDPVIHVHKGAFARRITVIHGPALDLLVQTLDHCSCRQAARVVDGFLDLGQERLDVVRRRLGQDLAAAIAPDVLPQEIEAFLHMRDLGFLVRELKPSFFQEMGHERLDLITEKFLRRACDQEVIRIAHQVDFGLPLSLRRVREVFRQQPL